MRGKIRQLEQTLDCSFFTEQHAFILAMMLANIDHLTAQVKELTAKIEILCEPYARQIAQLDAIPGFGVVTAQDIIAETGVDMTVFPTAGHLASCARQAPQVSESAGKRKGKNATGRGNPYIAGALGEASVNAGRTQTFLGAKYRLLVRHMPKKKAQGALSRTQLVICHALPSDPGAVYTDLGTDYYERRTDIRRRARALERLGYKVTIDPPRPRNQPPACHQSQLTCPPTPSRHRSAPPAAAACPPKVLFSDQDRTRNLSQRRGAFTDMPAGDC